MGAIPAISEPADRIYVADEDDVHKCGRCQAEFTSLEEFVQHKIQKRCQRGPEPALGPDGPKVTAGPGARPEG